LVLATKLSIKEELHYFKNLNLSYKGLDDIPKFFQIDEPEVMLNFIEEESASFTDEEKASFYNTLFQANWFLEYVMTGKIPQEKAKNIESILETYLNESDYLSEFEEQRTLQNITHLTCIGKPVSTKLEMSLALDVDNNLKANIQKGIIARISYDEIGEVIHYLEYLSVNRGEQVFDFLQKDFGLPIFQIDSASLKMLEENHAKLSEFEFYLHYLKEFGVDFLTKNGDLDYSKIYNILQFDIASPLVGSGGGKRDDYVYGIIKLLELTFNTRLGFHEKLNESQTFYTFTSSKRAHAWQQYIEEHKLLNDIPKCPPSFNKARVEY